MSLFKTYLEKIQDKNKPATISDLRNFLKANNLLKKNPQEQIFANYSKTLTLLMDKDFFVVEDDSKKYLNNLASSEDKNYSMEIKEGRIYFTKKEKEVSPPKQKQVVEKTSKPIKTKSDSEQVTKEAAPKNEVLISSDGTKFKIMPANEQGYFTVVSKKSNESDYSPFPGKDKDKTRLMESIKKEVKQESRNKNKIVKIVKE